MWASRVFPRRAQKCCASNVQAELVDQIYHSAPKTSVADKRHGDEGLPITNSPVDLAGGKQALLRVSQSGQSERYVTALDDDAGRSQTFDLSIWNVHFVSLAGQKKSVREERRLWTPNESKEGGLIFICLHEGKGEPKLAAEKGSASAREPPRECSSVKIFTRVYL